MAALDFPEALSDGQVFNAPNGVTYTYVGTPPDGYWSAAVSGGGGSGGSQDLQSVTDEGNETTNDILIGGTLPSAPNITLNADGSAKFAYRCDIGSSSLDNNVALKLVNNYAAAATLYVHNFNNNGDVFSGHDSSNVETSRIGVDGSASFAGKVTSASTEDSDGGTTLVTKDYLTGSGSGGTGAFGYWNRTGTELSPVNDGDSIRTGGIAYNGVPGFVTVPQGNAYVCAADGNAVYQGYIEGDTKPTSTIYSNGTAMFGGLIPSAPNITLNAADGSAEFASSLTIKNLTDTNAWAILARNNDGRGGRATIRAQNEAAGGELFTGVSADGSTQVFKISSDGSAEFAGKITTQRILAIAPSDSDPNWTGYSVDLNNDPTSRINGDGSATFAGEINGIKGYSVGKIGTDIDNAYGMSFVHAQDATNWTYHKVGYDYTQSPSRSANYCIFGKQNLLKNTDPDTITWSPVTKFYPTGGVYTIGAVQVGGIESAPNISLNTDGSAQFAGEVYAGQYDSSSNTTRGVLLGSTGGVYSQVAAGDANTGVLFQGMYGNTYTSRIQADGSATFVGDGIFRGSLSITGSGSSNALYVGDLGEAIIRLDGSAEFKGVMTLGASIQQTTSAVTTDINLQLSNYFTSTVNGNVTYTFSGAPSAGTSSSATLEVAYTSGTITWPASVKWSKDKVPTLTAGKTTLFMFVTDDGGSSYYGAALTDYTT